MGFLIKDKLTEIIVPDSVQSIGYAAFEGCNNLVKITVPFVGQVVNNNSTVETTGERAYFGWIFGRKVTSGALRKLSSFSI